MLAPSSLAPRARSHRCLLGLVCSSLLAACGPSGTSPSDASPADAAPAADAPPPADAPPVDAPPPGCPAHTHEIAPGNCDATLTFAESTPLPTARDHHGVAVLTTPAGARVVVVGGAVLPPGATDQTTTSNVSVAPIRADGTLGNWTDGPALPAPRAGMAIGVIGTTVIAVAGRSGSFQRTSYLSQMQADGTLGAWTTGPAIPEGRFHISGATAGRWMFVSGGLALRGTMTEARPEVYSARLGDDGVTLGEWQTLTPLPEPTSHHASFVRDGYLFVAGGLGGDPFNGADYARLGVYRARINDADGTLGAWEMVNELPVWVSTHSAAVHGDRVYLFGGVVDESNSDQILRAALMPGGALGEWEAWSTHLPTARAHLHYVPVHDGRAYFVSGSMEPHMPVPTTWVGAFD